MTRRSLLTATAIALVCAPIPVRTEADAVLGVEVSTASCAEAACGALSLADCFCPDVQEPNHKPQCDE